MKLNLRIVLTLAAAMSCTMLFAQQWEEGAGIPPTRANAQEIDEGNDVQGRFRASLEIPIGKNWEVTWSEQVRVMDNFSKLDKVVSSVGVGYKPWDFLKFGIDYSLVNERQYDTEEVEVQIPVLNDDGSQKVDNMTGEPIYNFAMQDVETKSWGLRHRTNIDVTGMYRIGRLKLSLRERLQTTFRTDSVNRYEKMNPEMILRSRLMAEYNIRHSKWSPYIFFELHNTLNAPQAVWNYKTDPFDFDNYITRYRTGLGAKYRITRNHRLEFYYYFDYDRTFNIDYKANAGTLKGYVRENEMRHIFGISYKFKL